MKRELEPRTRVRRKTWFAGSALLCVLAGAGTAHAQAPATASVAPPASLPVPVPVPWSGTARGTTSPAHAPLTSLGLRAAFGLGTPLGYGGLEAEARFDRVFAVDLGAGMGGSGLQEALELGLRTFLLGVDLGISTGAIGHVNLGRALGREDNGSFGQYDRAWWFNGDLSIGQEVGFRGFVGVAVMLHHDAGRCVQGCTPTQSPSFPAEILPFLGLQINSPLISL